MKYSLLLVLLITSWTVPGYSKTNYKTSNQKDISLLAGSGLLTGYSIYRTSKITPLTGNKIHQLNKYNINKFDRIACNYWSPQIANYSDYLLIGSILSPLSLMASHSIKDDYQTIGLMYFESILITTGVTQFIKTITKRIRPFGYNTNVPESFKLNNPGMRESFFSGHTSLSFTALVFTATIYDHYHPDSEWSPYIWSAAIGTASTVGLLRVLAGKHFPTDVITGAIVGGFTGYIIPKIHEKEMKTIQQKPNVFKVSINIPL